MRKPSRRLKAKIQQLVQAGLIEWSGRKPRYCKSVPRTWGKRTVAEILLENRELDDQSSGSTFR
jgi:hypothetical protein